MELILDHIGELHGHIITIIAFSSLLGIWTKMVGADCLQHGVLYSGPSLEHVGTHH